MDKIKSLSKYQLNKILKNPDSCNLAYKKYGKSDTINDYSDSEINEMAVGVYSDTKFLLSDDVFINMQEVIKSKCILIDVSYYQKPTLQSIKDNSCHYISNIRTFYIQDYFLITQNDKEVLEFPITQYLHKVGALRKGSGKYCKLFSIANDYKSLLNGQYPKDLFYPIKNYINRVFFNDDYRISEFELISDFHITSQ